MRHHACSLFPSHKTGMGCLLNSWPLCRDWSSASSHATPSKIERREFCNGILMLSQKQMCMINPCICSSWREGNSPVLRRSPLDGDVTGTLWLSILSSFGLSALLLRPTTYSWRSAWRVPSMTAVSFQDAHCPAKLRHFTLFPAFPSAWRLPRHTDCKQSESLPLPWCGRPGVNTLPLFCQCSPFLSDIFALVGTFPFQTDFQLIPRFSLPLSSAWHDCKNGCFCNYSFHLYLLYSFLSGYLYSQYPHIE